MHIKRRGFLGSVAAFLGLPVIVDKVPAESLPGGKVSTLAADGITSDKLARPNFVHICMVGLDGITRANVMPWDISVTVFTLDGLIDDRPMGKVKATDCKGWFIYGPIPEKWCTLRFEAPGALPYWVWSYQEGS